MPIGLTAATAITAGVGAAAVVGSAAMGAKASKDAAKAQQAAAQQAADTRMQMFDKARGYLEPYSELGKETLPTLKSLLGLGEEGAGGIMATLEKYPGYQFALGEGQKAIGNQAQAAGARYSGNALKAAADYNREMGANIFSDYFSKVSGIANMGLGASNSIANAATGVGSDIAGYQIGAGNAKAAGIMGAANAWSSGLNNIANIASSAMGAIGGAPGFSTNGIGSWSGATNAGALSRTPDGMPAGYYVMR